MPRCWPAALLLEVAKLFSDIEVVGQACPLWVPLIESNEHHTQGANYFVHKYIDALFAKNGNIDTLILGCTHYPLLLNQIEKAVPAGVNILTQGEIVAASLEDYLLRHPETASLCSKGGTVRFLTTESVEKFASSASIFLNQPIIAEHITI